MDCICSDYFQTLNINLFVLQVSLKLEELGYLNEARFCRAMSKWLAAHDSRGIAGVFSFRV